MSSISDSSVIIHTSSQVVPSAPPWWGELVILAQHLRQQGILVCLTEGIHLTRRRFGRYEVLDFLVVLFGYAISGERTLEAFYTWVLPLAPVFMALFGRDRLPSRSALSRFLSSLSWTATEALRSLFLTDLLARPLVPECQTGDLLDRCSASLLVFDMGFAHERNRKLE